MTAFDFGLFGPRWRPRSTTCSASGTMSSRRSARATRVGGIVAIRDEFRRAWRIISSVGKKEVQEGLLDEVVAETQLKSQFDQLMDLIHGKVEDAGENA